VCAVYVIVYASLLIVVDVGLSGSPVLVSFVLHSTCHLHMCTQSGSYSYRCGHELVGLSILYLHCYAEMMNCFISCEIVNK
jgi:hypothetical protein